MIKRFSEQLWTPGRVKKRGVEVLVDENACAEGKIQEHKESEEDVEPINKASSSNSDDASSRVSA